MADARVTLANFAQARGWRKRRFVAGCLMGEGPGGRMPFCLLRQSGGSARLKRLEGRSRNQVNRLEDAVAIQNMKKPTV